MNGTSTRDEQRAAVLRRAEAVYQAAARRAAMALDARNRAIREALRDGMSHGAVARELNLSRARIGQLAQRASTPPMPPCDVRGPEQT